MRTRTISTGAEIMDIDSKTGEILVSASNRTDYELIKQSKIQAYKLLSPNDFVMIKKCVICGEDFSQINKYETACWKRECKKLLRHKIYGKKGIKEIKKEQKNSEDSIETNIKAYRKLIILQELNLA